MKRPTKKVMKKAVAKAKPLGLNEAQFKKIALSFPGALEKPSYGMPSIFIAKKYFTRLRAEDNSLTLHVGSIDERDMLIEADPAIFHVTDHYRNYPIVLARLDKIDAQTLTRMLERRWREICPKRLRAAVPERATLPNKRAKA